jgi:hypothetical protein
MEKTAARLVRFIVFAFFAFLSLSHMFSGGQQKFLSREEEEKGGKGETEQRV